MKRAVFLDRDGVLNASIYRPQEETWDSPYTMDEFRLTPGASEAVNLIHDLGFLAIVVSNQPGVAKAKCDIAFLDELSSQMQEELEKAGTFLDAIYYCLHHPDATVLEYKTICDCRKPKPGLLHRAAEKYDIDLQRSYIVGDKIVDIQAGEAVGCKAVLIESKSTNANRRSTRHSHVPIVDDVVAALRQIEFAEAENQGRSRYHRYTAD